MLKQDEPEGLVLPAALGASVFAFLSGAVASAAAASRAEAGSLLKSPIFQTGLVASALAALVVGALVALAALRPVSRMSRALDAARRMAEGDLGARLPDGKGLSGALGSLLNAVGGSGARLLLAVKREQGRLNEEIAILRAAAIRTRERATIALSRIEGAETAVAGFGDASRSIAESVETLFSGSGETAAAVAQVDTSLTQVLARSEGLHRVSDDGARASVSLAEGASVLDGTLDALVKRADELRAAAQRSKEGVTRVASSAHESSGHAAHAATEAERGAHVVRGVRESIAALQGSAAAVGTAVARVEGRAREIGRVLEGIEEIA